MHSPMMKYGIPESLPGPEETNQDELIDALQAAMKKIGELEEQIRHLLPDTPLPCPFCGKETVRVALADERETTYKAVLTHSCCRGVKLLIRGDSPRDVIHLWNRRGGFDAR